MKFSLTTVEPHFFFSFAATCKVYVPAETPLNCANGVFVSLLDKTTFTAGPTSFSELIQ